MENSKSLSDGTKIVIVSSIIGIFVLIIIVWLVFHFLRPKKNIAVVPMQITPTITPIIPTDEPLITPKTVLSAKSGLKTFIFSNSSSRYSFDYPSTWDVVEIAHDNIVRLNFAGRCNVEFSTISNAGSANNNAKIEARAYGGRTFQMTTNKINNALYVESLTLINATSKDGFSIINVNLPSAGMSQCQNTVDQILASLTFGK